MGKGYFAEIYKKCYISRNIRGIFTLNWEIEYETVGFIPGRFESMEYDIEILTIKEAQRGSQQAWQNLFRWHFEPVYQYCLRLASGSQDIAEEITQQVFMTAAVRIGRFKPNQSAFRAWLIGIARNKSKKLKHSENRHKELKSQSLEKNSQNQKKQSETFVHEVLAKLPAHYRFVLEEKYIKGLKVNEIAQANCSTPKAVESLLGRARDKFAQVSRQMKDKNTM